METIKDLWNMINPWRETRLHKRLKNLWLYNCLYCFNTDRLHTLEKSGNDVLIEFKSNLGTVRIFIDLWGYDYEDDLKMEYYNYAGSTVFRIQAGRTWTPLVEPMLGENLTAHDIDLALLEIEEYLRDTYGDIDILWEEYIEYEKNKKKLHEEQVKELERR